MKRFVAALAAVLLGTAPVAFAANQVVSDTWRRAPLSEFRSDGIYLHKTYKSPRLVGNGDGFMAIGPTFYETFAYGDGLGVHCSQIWKSVVAFASGANTACDTTCGNAACDFGFDAGAADAEAAVACTDNTADTCACRTMPVDREMLGCGANWEAPALGGSLLTFASGVQLAHFALLAQDIGPDMDATSLDIGGDQTDNDGAEMLSGMHGASGRPMFPGVDPAFKFCVTFSIADISGTDEFWIGWRDTTEVNATFNSYNSYAVVGFDAADGDWATETEDDGGGTTTTDISGLTNATDGSTHKACVLVDDSGIATPQVDGGTPTGVASYTFDSGEPVVPFLHYLHATDLAGEIDITGWEVSYQ
jgi:hypothetical protein